MGLTLPVITLVTVVLLSSQALHVEAEQSGAVGAEQSSYIGPSSFAERQSRRKRQARRGPNRPVGPQVPQQAMGGGQDFMSDMSITVPNCVEEGMVLIKGLNNYYVKCINNPTHGGFFQVVYICPNGIPTAEDTSMCIPPPDCSGCSASSAGAGGGGDDLGFGGLI